MFQSFRKPLAVFIALCTFLPCVVSAQSTPLIEERRKKVINALKLAGVDIQIAGTTNTDFLSLVPNVERWAGVTASQPASPPAADKIPGLDDLIEGTFPRRWQRLGRFNQLKVEGQEQPRTVLAYPSTTATSTVPIDNPDHVLFKYTVTSKASEFFPTTQDTADQIKTLLDALGKKEAGGSEVGPMTKVLCKLQEQKPGSTPYKPEQVASCLSKTRKKDIFYRFLSGYTGTFSYSDNPQVVQNILIPSGSTLGFKNKLFSGEVLFDPANVFLSGTDWKNVASSAAAYDPAVKAEVMKKVTKPCPNIMTTAAGNPLKSCLNKLSSPSGWTAIAAALLPIVDYKIQTQFDYIKSGAVFIEPPYPLGHLFYFSFTQDLRRVFATTKQRNDALEAIIAFRKLEKSITVTQRDAVLNDFKALALDDGHLNVDDWYYAFLQKLSPLVGSGSEMAAAQ